MKEIKEQFEITADPSNAGGARARLRVAATDAGLTGNALDDLEVAMGEALSNAILHGSPNPQCSIRVCISFTPRTSEFVVEITDQGPGFDPATIQHDPSGYDLNGRGLKMMAALVDKAVLFHGGTGMTARLTLRVHTR